MTRARTSHRVGLAVLLALGAMLAFVAAGASKSTGERAQAGAGDLDPALVAAGRELFQEGCSSCHGLDARGVEGVGPSLRGAGAAAADFYLSTGRMPLDDPGDQPDRSEPRYAPEEIDALAAYVGSFGGPPIPEIDAAAGDLPRGQKLFESNCAGCHQIVGRGGTLTGAFAPELTEATPTELGEAVRVGPYLMPRFGPEAIGGAELDSIARYAESVKHPDDAGGLPIGNLGPIPEGLLAWLLALAALLVVARLIGERTR